MVILFTDAANTTFTVSETTYVLQSSAPSSVVVKSMPAGLQDETKRWEPRGRDTLSLLIAAWGWFSKPTESAKYHDSHSQTVIRLRGQWSKANPKPDGTSLNFDTTTNTTSIEMNATNRTWVTIDLVRSFSEDRQPLTWLEEDQHVERARRALREWLAGSPRPPSTADDHSYGYNIRTKWIDTDVDSLQALKDASYSSGMQAFELDGDTSEIKEVVRSRLRRLVVGYSIHNITTFPSKRFLMEDLALLNYTMAIFRWIGQRGVNGSYFDPGFKTDAGDLWPDAQGTSDQIFEWDYWGNLGFKTGRFNAFGRLEAGLSDSTVLMLDHLKRHDLFDTYTVGPVAALRAFTWRWGANTRFLGDEGWFSFPGMNSDHARVLMKDRLSYCLCLEYQGDGDGSRFECLKAFKAWADKSLAIGNHVSDSFKPDGTMNHHQMIYGNAYSINLLEGAVRAAWLLQDSPWQLSAASLENIALGLAVLRTYSVGGKVARALGGRLVELDNNVFNPTLFCSFVQASILAARGIFRKRWHDIFKAVVFQMDRSHHDGFEQGVKEADPGCINLWYHFKETYSSPDVRKAHSLGHTTFGLGAALFPFAGMATIRFKSGWTVIAKGYDRNVKNTYEMHGSNPPSSNTHGV